MRTLTVDVVRKMPGNDPWIPDRLPRPFSGKYPTRLALKVGDWEYVGKPVKWAVDTYNKKEKAAAAGFELDNCYAAEFDHGGVFHWSTGPFGVYRVNGQISYWYRPFHRGLVGNVGSWLQEKLNLVALVQPDNSVVKIYSPKPVQALDQADFQEYATWRVAWVKVLNERVHRG